MGGGRRRHKHAYLSGYPEVSGIPVVLLIPQRNSRLKESLRMPLVEIALVFTGICFVFLLLILVAGQSCHKKNLQPQYVAVAVRV